MRSLGKAVLAGSLLLATSIGLGAAEQKRRTVASGPVYVPVDSWVYPAIKRLASLGYVPDADSLVMPWTRRQCAMLIAEAEDVESRRSTRISAGKLDDVARGLIFELKREFAQDFSDNSHAGIESVYTRATGIAGTPLRDSFHFGQTLVNDFGRPYSQGGSTIAGMSAYASYGRFSGYVRAEYEQAPSSQPYSVNVRNTVAMIDGVPLRLPSSTGSVSRVEPIEAYVGMAVGPFDMTFGRQSAWWGPGEASSFHLSTNAQPFDAFRMQQNKPLLLPGPFRVLGRIRTSFIVGRLAGHEFPPRPLINAQKITLQVTENLELGFTRSSIFGGVGHPLTASSIFQSFFSSTSPGSGADPGDRRGGFDFRWYVPKFRRRLTIYSDSLSDDDPNPLANPRRAAWAPGIYLSSVPYLPHLDLRFETYSTLLYRKDEGGRFIYWNNQYQDGYTNNGFIIGSWIGRDARAYTASSNYWFAADKKLTASWRQTTTGGKFLPGGGTQTDVSLSAQWRIRPEWLASVFVQAERYNVPVLGSPRRNLVSQLQLTYYPRNWRLSR